MEQEENITGGQAESSAEQVVDGGAGGFNLENMGEFSDKAISFIAEYGLKILAAILIVWIGLKIIAKVEKLLKVGFAKAGLDFAVIPFLTSMIIITAKIFLFLTAAGMIGFESSSLVAVLAAAGFAIGMALQGSLANFASGVLLLIFKPYKVGDLVDLGEEHGHVDEIQILNTMITTLENKRVIIPNSIPLSGAITNYSVKPNLRVDLNVYMPYSEEFDKIEALLLAAIKEIPQVLDTPKPFVGIEEFDTHSIKLAVRPYCNPEDYWDVYFEGNRKIKEALGKAGVKVAYSEGVELGDIGK